MTRKVGKEPEGGSKKRKEVGNANSLASMFAKQQAVSAQKSHHGDRKACAGQGCQDVSLQNQLEDYSALFGASDNRTCRP